MPRYAIGVDIGGTNTKLALVDEGRQVHRRDALPTPHHAQPKSMVDAIIRAVLAFRGQAASAETPITGIGLAVPHFSEGELWVQRHAQNLPALEGFALYPPLRAALGPAIAIINDVSAAGIAEYRYGRGRGCERMLLMAIGTGIATSLVTREQGLVRYSWDSMGDTGQIIVDPSGQAECSCGGRGCLEAVAAAPAIRRRALAEVQRGRATLLARVQADRGELEAGDVTEAARAGDAVAIDILEQAGHYLGVALTSYLHIYRPTRIVLAGGVAQAGDLLIRPIRRTLERLASPGYLGHLEGIEITVLGQECAAVGCASLMLDPGILAG